MTLQKILQLVRLLLGFLDSFYSSPGAIQGVTVHQTKATSFADANDIKNFHHCRASGGSESACFAGADNGVGLWGDSTVGDVAMCALPPEDWNALGEAARGAIVMVTVGVNTIKCELRDTMPRRKNIKNGAGIDLNAAACSKLKLSPPILVNATWWFQ